MVSHRPLNLNPLLNSSDATVHDLNALLYRGLLRLDNTQQPVSDLASSWAISGDGLSYQFTLPNNLQLRWSDGKPITVLDVAATIAWVQRSDFPDTNLSSIWHDIRVTTNNYKVTLTLPSARASFGVAVTNLPILPADILRNVSSEKLAKAAIQPIPTSGSYKIETTNSQALILTANRWATRQPTLSRIEFLLESNFDEAMQALEHGEVDGTLAYTPAQSNALKSVNNLDVHTIGTYRFVDLLFNERVTGLDNTVVRQAINMATDRKALVGKALDNTGIIQAGAINKGIGWIRGNDNQLPSFDLAKVKQQLDQAGWRVGTNGVRYNGVTKLAFELTVPDVNSMSAVAQQIATQLKPLGIEIQPHNVPTGNFVDRVLVPGRFSLALADWSGGADPDVSSFWRSNATPPQGFNVSEAPRDPFLDQALDALATVSDPQLRYQAVARVNIQLAEDVPAVFLYTPAVTFAIKTNFGNLEMPQGGDSGARFANFQVWQKK